MPSSEPVAPDPSDQQPATLRLLTRSLSLIKDKRERYLEDADYRDALLQTLHSRGARALEYAASHGIVLIKPDALVTGQAETIVDVLESRGFTIAMAASMQLDTRTVRSLWFYPFRFASVDRVLLTEDLLALCPSVLLMVRRRDRDAVPASVLLSELKGRVNLDERKPEDLRSILRSPNRFLSFVHTSDEPADVLREARILFPGPAFGAMTAQCDVGAQIDRASVSALIDACADAAARAARCPLPWGFELHESCGRVLDRAASLCGQERNPHTALDYRSLRHLLDTLAERGEGCHDWCRLLYSADRIDPFNHEMAQVRIFGRAEVASWKALVA